MADDVFNQGSVIAGQVSKAGGKNQNGIRLLPDSKGRPGNGMDPHPAGNGYRPPGQLRSPFRRDVFGRF